MIDTKPPRVFISYAWEDDLKTWVLDFATRLRSDGINAILDQWETLPGDQLPEFMEKSVRESDFVVFVCTPTYKRKSDHRKGGVGYEGHIISGEVFQKNNHRKFIPLLRKGKWAVAAPSWATSKLFIDFRGDPYSEVSYQQLLNTLFGKSPTAPPIRDDSLREKEERESAEKAVREKASLEASDKIAQEKAEYEAAEKAKREALEKDERERIEREATERLDREASEKSTRQKEEQEVAEKAEEEKKQRELKRELKKIDQEYNRKIRNIKWQHRWNSFVGEIRYRLRLVWIYRAPILILLITFGLIVPLLIRLSNLIPKITSESPAATIGLSLAPQQNLTPIKTFTPDEILSPSSASTENIATATMCSIPPGWVEYIIQSGDTLYAIALSTSSSVDQLQQANCLLPSDILKSEQVLWVPSLPKVTETTATFTLTAVPIGTMILVPAGEFTMGSTSGDLDEKPVHQVYLDAYYIDKYLVTNAEYRMCPTDVCKPPKYINSATHNSYFSDSQFDNYPVINIDWNMANTYCEWRGAQLPTEAQWEKAARGTDNRTYPWGESIDKTYANYNNNVGDTTAVGSYEKGKSFYGVYDMAGTLWQWVADWYDANYYDVLGFSTINNPQGPVSGQSRILRGGSWASPDVNLRSASRYVYSSSSNILQTVGFRCAFTP